MRNLSFSLSIFGVSFPVFWFFLLYFIYIITLYMFDFVRYVEHQKAPLTRPSKMHDDLHLGIVVSFHLKTRHSKVVMRQIKRSSQLVIDPILVYASN